MRELRMKERNKSQGNWKRKISMLLVLCLILTGSHGLVLSADAQEEQGGSSNRIESKGENIKLHFNGDDLRQAAGAAIYEGTKFSVSESLSYSKDEELLRLYRDSLAEGKELYEISLDNFVVGTEEVYTETGAKVRAIVEIDPAERTGEIEKQGKDALGFFAKDSSFGHLMEKANPVWYEEALAAEKLKENLDSEESKEKKASEEAKAASEENAEAKEAVTETKQKDTEAKQGTTESKPENTETEKEAASTENKSQEEVLKEVENAKAPDFINLDAKNEEYVVQGTELIHFLYENHGEKDLRFQLFVDSNSYPGVKVQSKAKLAKSILEDVKSLEDKIKKTNAKKDGEEQEVKQNTEALPSTEQSNESLASSEESQSTELTTATEAGQSSETVPATKESQSTEASVSVEESQEQSTVVITEVKAEREKKKEKAKNSQEDPILALYQEMKADITPFLSELYTAKYQIYSLNELGRKSQHKEVEDFGVVEVFYDKEAFPEAVTLQVSKRVKPEEAKSDESKLSDAQVEALKVRGYYEDSRSIDIHFVNKEGVEVEPTLPVAVRISISKDTLPKEAKPENIAIHHLVEEEGSDKIAYVETVSDTEKKKKNLVEENAKEAEELAKNEGLGGKTEEEENNQQGTEGAKEEDKNSITDKSAYIVREFNVKSFSIYTLTWSKGPNAARNTTAKFYYVDGDFRQVGPSISVDMSQFTDEQLLYQSIRYRPGGGYEVSYAYQDLPGYTRHDRVYPGYHDLDHFLLNEKVKEDLEKAKEDLEKDKYNLEKANKVKKAEEDLEKAKKDREKNINNDMQWGDEVYYMSTKHMVSKFVYDDYVYRNATEGRSWGDYWNMTTWDSGQSLPNYPDRKVCYPYYYFFYKLDTKTHTHTNTYPKKNLEMEQEKYITKKADGSYDLTLTARPVVEGGQKNKLDLIFVYDKSMYMGFPYNEEVKKDKTRPEYNKIDSDGGVGTRHYYGKKFVNDLVEDLSKSPAYDAQFALVTMGGTRDITYDVPGGQFKGVKSLSDTPYNDAEKVLGFTKDVSLFQQTVNGITLEGESGNGLNYAAGIKEAVNFQNGATAGAHTQSIRQDARRVVIFITAYDPNFSYFPKYNADGNHPFYFLQRAEKYNASGQLIGYGNVPGKVEDKANIGGGTSALPAGIYKFTADYKAGYSYGSGRGYEEAALTQARAELTNLNSIDAFYTLGFGPKKNYSHLEDLTGKSVRWMIARHPKESPLADDIEQENFSIEVAAGTANSGIESAVNKEKDRIRGFVAPIRITEMHIWDQLSENVEVNFDPSNQADKNQKLRAEVWKVDAQGKPISKVENPKSEKGFSGFLGFGYWHNNNFLEVGPVYDAGAQTLSLKIGTENFSFPAGYEIRLTVNVKPTVKAYEKYQKNFMDYFDKETERQIKAGTNDIGYLDNVNGSNISGTRTPDSTSTVKLGDLRTDQWYLYQMIPEETFHTSSQKDGFYSNEGAYLQYRRFKGKDDNDIPKNKYQKPVIQIEPATLRIVKSFVGTTSSTEELELLKNTSFILKEQIPGSTNYREVKRFTMTKSVIDSTLGYLVSEELNGTKLSGTGKNLTPEKPAGTLQATMQGGKKQYVLSINGLIPGRKYQVEEAISASGQNPVIGGSQLHFKKMAITAGADSTATSGNYEIATVSMGKNETKEINVQNTYEREDRQILRIEKQVSGEMANENQDFPFRLKLFKAENQPITQSDFDSIKADFPAATKSAISFDPGTATISFSLKHGQAIEFLLPKTYYYMAGENPSGYLPSVSTGYVLQQATDAQGFRFTKKKLLGRNTDGSKQVLQFRNVKDPISPTGVVEEGKPLSMVFAAFLLFSGAVAFGMKKKEEG